MAGVMAVPASPLPSEISVDELFSLVSVVAAYVGDTDGALKPGASRAAVGGRDAHALTPLTVRSILRSLPAVVAALRQRVTAADSARAAAVRENVAMKRLLSQLTDVASQQRSMLDESVGQVARAREEAAALAAQNTRLQLQAARDAQVRIASSASPAAAVDVAPVRASAPAMAATATATTATAGDVPLAPPPAAPSAAAVVSGAPTMLPSQHRCARCGCLIACAPALPAHVPRGDALTQPQGIHDTHEQASTIAPSSHAAFAAPQPAAAAPAEREPAARRASSVPAAASSAVEERDARERAATAERALEDCRRALRASAADATFLRDKCGRLEHLLQSLEGVVAAQREAIAQLSAAEDAARLQRRVLLMSAGRTAGVGATAALPRSAAPRTWSPAGSVDGPAGAAAIHPPRNGDHGRAAEEGSRDSDEGADASGHDGEGSGTHDDDDDDGAAFDRVLEETSVERLQRPAHGSGVDGSRWDNHGEEDGASLSPGRKKRSGVTTHDGVDDHDGDDALGATVAGFRPPGPSGAARWLRSGDAPEAGSHRSDIAGTVPLSPLRPGGDKPPDAEARTAVAAGAASAAQPASLSRPPLSPDVRSRYLYGRPDGGRVHVPQLSAGSAAVSGGSR